jgi:hypothetical protein
MAKVIVFSGAPEILTISWRHRSSLMFFSSERWVAIVLFLGVFGILL